MVAAAAVDAAVAVAVVDAAAVDAVAAGAAAELAAFPGVAAAFAEPGSFLTKLTEAVPYGRVRQCRPGLSLF